MKKYLFIFCFFSPFGLLSQTVDKEALDTLIAWAKKTHSSALVVYQNDKLILNQCFDSVYIPLDANSATKSFVNLGIGLLITNGKLNSIDTPVYRFYPEWNQGLKKKITIRHLLNHTSGLQSTARADDEIYLSPNYVQLALSAEISDTPGSSFFYNNKAVNLLAGIIQKASGMRMDKYINQNLFAPLGIKNFNWLSDISIYKTKKEFEPTLLKKGNSIGMAELLIRADDMAKVGLLVQHKGYWKGKQIINESWFEESTKPGQKFNGTCGLLWWLVYDFTASFITFDNSNIQKIQEAGLNDTSLINDLKKITGRYNNNNEFLMALDALPSVKKIGGSDEFIKLYHEDYLHSSDANCHDNIHHDIYTFVKEKATRIGFAAKGYLGQLITIFPDKKLVVVRTISHKNFKQKSDNFFEFDNLSYQLVK